MRRTFSFSEVSNKFETGSKQVSSTTMQRPVLTLFLVLAFPGMGHAKTEKMRVDQDLPKCRFIKNRF